MKQEINTAKINRYINLVLVAIICLVLFFCYYGYPLFTDDSECFLPTAFAIKKGLGLYNPFYDAGFIPNNKFSFYPPLFPLIVSAFMYSTTAEALYLSVTIINLLSVVCSVFVLKFFIKKYSSSFKNTSAIIVFSILWIFANCSFILTGNARPEIVCRLLMYLVILLALYQGRFNYFFAGCICVAGCITSPAFGIYLMLIALQYILFKGLYKAVFPAVVGGVFVLVLFLWLYPYTISELIQTMHTHSERVVFVSHDPFTLAGFYTYHVFAYNASFGIALFAVSVMIVVKKINKVQNRLNKFLIAILFCMHMGLILYITVRNLPMAYYIYVLSPLMLFVVAEDFFSISPKTILNWHIMLAFLVSFSFIRLTFAFVANAGQKGYLLTDVQGQMTKYRSMTGVRIGVSSSMWVFFGEDVLCKPDIYRGENAKNFDYLILQQYATGQLTPEQINGFEIVENHFASNLSLPARIAGSKYPPFYQYAVYKRK